MAQSAVLPTMASPACVQIAHTQQSGSPPEGGMVCSPTSATLHRKRIFEVRVVQMSQKYCFSRGSAISDGSGPLDF